ncbi:PTS system mannose/fructose/sorbose family transporter subunit IID [Enterococcus gallinarum]|uniref:PTS system mannose/fructose/sorbose family transporter subunit IID n=1 Tax=Enterococcus gallinarum TaxID=1353 RepID=UPI001473BFD3|nr:PTS system mannose/fructose/sorbose family transporter subunit IID [Enterococcus gallinarum]MDV7824400.1 PTS system mannose/fructose/sorbose family transporter subunit IID [Enterococcus gallinarum]MDV7872575.1 PTS system mannose/fructose/sorbose family transporter subunit IID [Enterococcus gallinarum]NME48368.1 PTS system mannose/fructose/sorbose family transporter subunit IID [Enterococcus gallinarum]
MDAENTSTENNGLTKKELNQIWNRWYWMNEIPRTYERQVAPALMYALTPLLKKIYKDPEYLRDAYNRHLTFWNTDAIWGGSTISGITASLEEQRAKELAETGSEQTVSTELIEATKVGLMGPMAGIGDSINNGTLQYLLIAIALPWAADGLWFGAVIPWIVFSVVTYLYGRAFVHFSYRLGRQAARELIAGTRANLIMKALTIQSSLSFVLSEREFALQSILDSILPGILPLSLVMGLYFYFEKKGLNVLKGMLLLTVIVGLLAAIGIL